MPRLRASSDPSDYGPGLSLATRECPPSMSQQTENPSTVPSKDERPVLEFDVIMHDNSVSVITWYPADVSGSYEVSKTVFPLIALVSSLI